MDISKIPTGSNPPAEINAVIEIPQGGVPVKYELDKGSGAVFVDRFLHTAMFYPGNYGFIPHTLSEDGDPVDVLVVTQVPVVPGAVIRCRPVGVPIRLVGSVSCRRRRHSRNSVIAITAMASR